MREYEGRGIVVICHLGARFVPFHITISIITLIFFSLFDMPRTSNRAFSLSFQGKEVG